MRKILIKSALPHLRTTLTQLWLIAKLLRKLLTFSNRLENWRQITYFLSSLIYRIQPNQHHGKTHLQVAFLKAEAEKTTQTQPYILSVKHGKKTIWKMRPDTYTNKTALRRIQKQIPKQTKEQPGNQGQTPDPSYRSQQISTEKLADRFRH